VSDTALSLLFDILSIGLVVIGIIISYHSPKSRAAKIIVTVSLLVLGMGAFAAQWTLHIQNEKAHANEIAEWKTRFDAQSVKFDAQSKKLDAVQRNTERFLNRATKHSEQSDLSTPGQKEIGRRQQILAALRNEYVLSHDNVSPAVMSGIQSPPADWVNQRLKALGEKWTIAEQYQAQSLSPEVRCSMNVADCSNQDIKNKVSQIADALDAAYAKYAEFQRTPIEPDKEHTHAARLSTMRAMTIFEYQGEAEASVNKYRHELIRRLDLGNADRSFDYLYEPARQRQMEDFREIVGDLRSLAARLPNVDRNKSVR
jgi:hypothetical protein